jgi:uncharacterized protein
MAGSIKVAIAGGTGFVGSALVARLQSLGHSVVILTRDIAAAKAKLKGQSQSLSFFGLSDWESGIATCDAVVNLAGEPIAESRWTPAVKQQILDSRVKTTERIVAAINASFNNGATKPEVLVNASAIGFYGTSEGDRFDETSPAGKDFLAEVCTQWETSAQAVPSRLVILRLGIVLENGGALGKMLTPFRLFAGGPIGSGKQWFSWIHRDDLVNLMVMAIEDNTMQGIYNATAPNPVRMTEFCQVLGKALNRPSWLPVPPFALEALLGDGAMVVLEGQQVMPDRLTARGFTYQFPAVEGAIKAIV